MNAWTFEAIGTAWQIDSAEPIAADVRARVLERIESFDRTWSRFRPDSWVTQVSERAGTWTLPDDADYLLGFYAQLQAATDGAVDPLVGQTLVDLGYDADYSLVPASEPFLPPGEFGWYAASLEIHSGEPEAPTFETAEPLLIDVGAAGKGLLVDHVATIVGQHTHRFTVDASGDMYHGGTSPIRVALEHPRDPTKAIGVAEIDPEDALCGSATNRRAWGNGLHHVIDARTGRPAGDVVATWVVTSQSCMHADGLATAHFFAPPEALEAVYPHEFVRMYSDGRVQWSAGFPGEVFA